jgi:predicted RNA-binding protein Jag
MDKKLPSVFANKITKKIENNESVFYSKNKEESAKEKKAKDTRTTKIAKNISQKINDIFSATDFIYKADVEITYDNQTIIKRLIGRNNKALITYDNELIPIDKITDIKKVEK